MIKAQKEEKNREKVAFCTCACGSHWHPGWRHWQSSLHSYPRGHWLSPTYNLCMLFFLLFRVKKILFRMGKSTILHFEIYLVLRGTLKESEYIQEPQEIWGQQFWWMNTKNRPLFCCFHFSLVFTRTLAVRPLKIIRTGLKIAEAWIWFKWEPSVTRSKSGSLLRWWIGFHIQYLERELFVSTAGAL